MKIIDIIFALISGYVVGWIARDFLKGYGVDIGFFYNLLLHYLLPLFSLFCLWIAYLIGKKFLFVFQGAKHLLVGAFVTVIDLKLFEFLVWGFSLFFAITPAVLKGVSFLVATSIKYWGNKHWAFEKHEKEDMIREISQFLIVTVVGLGIDVGSFFYFTKIMGPQFATPEPVWVKLSVILAAIVAALWTFAGYKFLVFKK
jgi:putative flippase GtrA